MNGQGVFIKEDGNVIKGIFVDGQIMNQENNFN